MIQTVKGSVLDNLPDYSVLLHQCNAKGWMNAGLARQIAQRWPENFKKYHEFCGWYKNGHEREILGVIVPCQISDKFIICNAIGQLTVGRDKQFTDYNAWHTMCKKLEYQTRWNNKRTGQNWTIHVPDKIGCGLGGGDYEEVHKIFSQYFDDSPVSLTFYSLSV